MSVFIKKDLETFRVTLFDKTQVDPKRKKGFEF